MPVSSSTHQIVRRLQTQALSGRSFTEKVADAITTYLGSMPFLVFNVLWYTLWILINIGVIPFLPVFDPYPFGLLTMIVSLEAIFLSVIVLISQNRAAQIDRLREEIDLQVNVIAEEEITKIINLLVLLLKKNGIDTTHDPELKSMLQPADPGQIEKTLRKRDSR